ncbi:MAG: hypothetical protein ABW278_12805 [Steroidobacteraceae bacterium]
MTVRLSAEGTLLLAGECPSEDAEPLLLHLLDAPQTPVDWRQCTAAHTAVLQVLLLTRPKLLGPPASPQLAQWLQPLLSARP